MKEHGTTSLTEGEPSNRSGPSLVALSGVEHERPLTGDAAPTGNGLEGCREPSRAELRAIEHEGELLQAELDLVDAECAWYGNPTSETAADLFGALIRLIDLYDLMVHQSERAVA